MDKAKTQQILDKICHEIGGDWLLVGGTLVQMHYDGERATEDIDLVQITHATKSRESLQNELFQFTQSTFGMGPEYINLSVEFFVQDLEGWQSEIIPLQKGRAGQIFRPSLTLFCALKMRRSSELDLRDIVTVAEKEGSGTLNWTKISKWLPAEKVKTLEKLLAAR